MKFRSWNEELGKFIYFEDGYYSYFEKGVEKYFLLGTDFNDLMMRNGKHYQFDWQKAEQVSSYKDIHGKEIFKGDNLYENGELIGSVDIQFDCFVILNQDGKTSEQFLYEINFARIEKKGNIHEGEQE